MTFNIKRHFERAHPKEYRICEQKDSKSAANMNKRKSKTKFVQVKRLNISSAKSSSSASNLTSSQSQQSQSKGKPKIQVQQTITDFISVSPVMQRAINLVVKNGVSFSIFASEDMQNLITAAKTGLKDHSRAIINPDNLKKAVREFAALKADLLRKKIERRVISLSADFATCGRRQFLGM